MKLEKLATLIASAVAFFLTIVKFIVGFISWSIAILSSAIDSLLDLFVSVFNYIAVKNSSKPADRFFNYGMGKIESLASFVEGVIIFLSWLYILYQSIFKIIDPKPLEYINSALLVMIFSTVVTAWLVYFLSYIANKTDNLVVKSDLLHYKTDLLTNWWILTAIIVIKYSWLYIVDGIIWVVISFYILYAAYKLIREAFFLILDVSLPEEEVKKIINIINSAPRVTSYHFLKTRQAGNTKFVDVHVVFNKNISLLEAHDISDQIEYRIRLLDPQKQWAITIHLDPYDDSKENKNSLNIA